MNLRRLSHFDKRRACSVGVGRSPTHRGRCKGDRRRSNANVEWKSIQAPAEDDDDDN